MRIFHLSFFSGVLLACALAIRDAPLRLYSAALDFVTGALELLRPEPLVLAGEGYVDFTGGGEPLDLALQNGLRHEAHMRNRAAHRNI